MPQSINQKKPIWPTVLGLILALAIPLFYALFLSPRFVQPAITPMGNALVGFGLYWAIAVALLALTRFGEGKAISSVGWRPLSGRDTAVAIILGILLSLAVPLLTWLMSLILPAPDTGTIIDTASNYPAGIVLMGVLTAGITEELLFRGYAIERLLELSDKPWLSIAVSLAVFVVIHSSGWNLNHVLGVVLPLGAILTGLYMWKRNLLFVMIVHVLIDLPLFVIALVS